MRSLCALAMVCAAAAGTAHAQESSATREGCVSPIISRLFPLEYIANAAAAKLVAPFVPSHPYCGVFEAGSAVRGITIKAPKEIIDRVDSLLRANDRPPSTVVLRFQLIAALDSAVRDPTIPSDVEASLRELFRFGGYRVLAQGSTTVGNSDYHLTMAHGAERYSIMGMVEDVRTRQPSSGRGASSSVKLTVFMDGTFDAFETVAKGRAKERLLSTGLTVPIGQTIVLGSAASSEGRRALILTVRPEMLTERR